MVEVEEKVAINARAGPFVVVGIPAFDEEKTIAKVVLECQRYADKVIVCDDGSSDLTGEIALRLGAEVFRHDVNLGYGAAIQSLMNRAKELGADVLVTLDGDCQHDPRYIPNVVEPIKNGLADMVVGSRFIDRRLSGVMPWYRRAGVKFISHLTARANNVKNGVGDAQSGFRAYSDACLSKLVVTENGMGASAEILINARKQGFKIKEVAASCAYSHEVRNHVHNPVSHGASVITSIVRLVVEDKPLLFLGLPGMLFLVAGMFFGVWLLQIYASENHIVTNIALASMAFIMIGFFALSTAITLYGIKRSIARLRS